MSEEQNISPARKQWAEDLRHLASCVEAGQDIDVMIISYRLARVDGVEADDVIFIEGTFFDPEYTTFLELREQASSVGEVVDNMIEDHNQTIRTP